MIPVDLELFKVLMPVLVVLWAVIFFLWSRVEHPLRTVQLDSASNEAFVKLKELLNKKGFSKIEEDDERRRVKIKGILKIVDIILYRCWSKEIIFRVVDDNSRSKLIVTCKPSALRIAASSNNPNYITRDNLDNLLLEIGEIGSG